MSSLLLVFPTFLSTLIFECIRCVYYLYKKQHRMVLNPALFQSEKVEVTSVNSNSPLPVPNQGFHKGGSALMRYFQNHIFSP